MHRKQFPNLLIIAGSGRKVGKTFLALAVLRFFSEKFPLVALKISPHIHDSIGRARLVASSEGFRIFQEMETHPKNSGQFLEAGALQAFFMETDDSHLAEAFELFCRECNPMNHPVICESGALGNLVRPGLLIFISHSNADLQGHKLDAMNQADMVFPAKNFSTREIISKMDFSENKWHLIS